MVGMDVTHVNGCHYLTLIDCGPTRFVFGDACSDRTLTV